jgi:hypothetical protein
MVAHRPIAFLPQRIPAIDHQGRSGHVAGGVVGQAHRERSQLYRLTEIAERNVCARKRSIGVRSYYGEENEPTPIPTPIPDL